MLYVHLFIIFIIIFGRYNKNNNFNLQVMISNKSKVYWISTKIVSIFLYGNGMLIIFICIFTAIKNILRYRDNLMLLRLTYILVIRIELWNLLNLFSVTICASWIFNGKFNGKSIISSSHPRQCTKLIVYILKRNRKRRREKEKRAWNW